MDGSRWVMSSMTVLSALIGAHCAFAESVSKSVRVSATILPRLEISVTPETGSDISFGAIEQPAPGDTAGRSVKVNVGVFSNLGHPYQITQTVRQPLISTDGARIPDEQFVVSTRDATQGSLAAPQPVAVSPGTTTTLYTSNGRGKSDSFIADYSLRVTPQTPAGDFTTEIVYSVTSL